MKSSEKEEVELTVKRTYLQMRNPRDLRAAKLSDSLIRIECLTDCPPSFYRCLYTEVGRNYHWIDRLPWTDDQISSHLDRPDLSLWLMSYDGAPAGYFELERHEDGSTEIAYFGLLPEFIGRGLGKHLLTVAVEEAWKTDANRVWLHTCTLDEASALPNYLKRGFTPFKEETYTTRLAEHETVLRTRLSRAS